MALMLLRGWIGIILLASTRCLFAMPAPQGGPVVEDFDALVARLAGADLASMEMQRQAPGGTSWQAAELLRSRKDESLPALARGLESNDRQVRANVVFVLNRIGTPATLPSRLLAVTDPDLGVRVAAIAHLPVYTDVEASKAVRAFLNDPAPGVRGAAVMAYGRLAGDPGNDLRLDAAMAIIPLLDDPEVRTGAAEILGRLGMNVAARPMLKLLNVRDESVRTVALRALGEFEDKDTALPVVAVLRDPSPSVRTAAARTLGRIADVRTTPALVAALSDGEPSVRGASAWALGRIGDRRAVPALIDLLKHPNERVQASAAEALGEIGDPSAVDAIGELLARNSRIGTAAATIALRRLRDSRSIRSLSAYLLEPAPREVPRQAAEALAAIPDPEAIEALVRVACSPGTHDQARLEARRALGDAVGRGFLNEPPETIRKWWEQNREDYMRPLPAAD